VVPLPHPERRQQATVLADPHRREPTTATSHADDLSLEDKSCGTDDGTPVSKA